MCAEPGIRWRSAFYRMLLLIIVPLLLAACGSVQIFDSFGEDETETPVAPDEQVSAVDADAVLVAAIMSHTEALREPPEGRLTFALVNKALLRTTPPPDS